MTERIELEIENLEAQEKEIFELAKEMLAEEVFALDILANAVMDRSIHLIFGFTTLIKDKNFIAASHLVRCHLDNIIRFSAAWIVDDSHKFANDVLAGIKIESLKDKDGNSLKDWYLRDILSKDFPWITKVYKESSGYIHLSHKHIFASTRLKEKNSRTIEFKLSRTNNFVPVEAELEAILCMQEITKVLIHFIKGWIWTKNNPSKMPNK